jgi:hypothetical protein
MVVIFFSVVPKYLNFSTFSNYSLAILLFWLREIATEEKQEQDGRLLKYKYSDCILQTHTVPDEINRIEHGDWLQEAGSQNDIYIFLPEEKIWQEEYIGADRNTALAFELQTGFNSRGPSHGRKNFYRTF